MTLGMMMTRAEALAELARWGVPSISGGSGEGDGGGDDAGGDSDQGDGDDDKGGAKAAIAAERIARKDAERNAKELQRQLDELKGKDQSELDRTKGELTKLQEQLTTATAKAMERAAKSALIDEATKAGAMKPEVVFRLVKDQAEHDDDGEVTNAASLIQQAKKDAPELFRSEKGGGGNAGAKDEKGGDDSAFGMDRLRSAYAESTKRR